jgi:hypothetical protein
MQRPLVTFGFRYGTKSLRLVSTVSIGGGCRAYAKNYVDDERSKTKAVAGRELSAVCDRGMEIP